MIFGYDWHVIIPVTKAILLFVTGYIAAKLAARASVKFCVAHATPQQCMILKKIVFFTVFLIFFVASLQQLEFKLTVLLGSVGIATAAIGFAAQTSMSNLISGVFLIIEKAFEVGDTIKFKGITGKVKSIDLLSVKVCTFENTYVRFPNSMIISTELINLTRYPKRRLDILVGSSYEANLDAVKKTLIEIAKSNELSLTDPEPKVVVTDFADSAVNLRLSVWVKKAQYAELKDALQEKIQAAAIDIPYPQLTVHLVKES